jgi:hypothetical protein
MGEWVGTRENRWCEWDATIRITSYDQATRAFKGDGYFVSPDADKWATIPPKIDLIIKGMIDEKGRVVMTVHEDGGRNSSFNLRRERDGRLSGMTSYGPPSLSLEKKR